MRKNISQLYNKQQFIRQSRRRQSRGQVLILFSLSAFLMFAIMILSLDVAYGGFHEWEDQNFADAVALAASHYFAQDVYNNVSNSESATTTFVNYLAEKNGCSNNCIVQVIYEDDLGNSDSNQSTVTQIAVIINDFTPSFFPYQTNSNGYANLNFTLSSVSQVPLISTVTEVTPPCALCLLAPPGVNGLDIPNAANISSSGNLNIDGNMYLGGGNGKLNVNGNIDVAGAYDINSWSVSPNTSSWNNNSFADPLAGIATPSSSGLTTYGNVVDSSSGNHTLVPGIYGAICLTGSGKYTFAPGQYIFAGNSPVSSTSCGTSSPGGGLYVAGRGSVQGTGVNFYFTCGTYSNPQLCDPGQQGSTFIFGSSGSLRFFAPTGGNGEYLEPLFFFDRNDVASMQLDKSLSATFGGAIYGANTSIVLGSSMSFSLQPYSPIVAYSITIGGQISFSTGDSGTVQTTVDSSTTPPYLYP